jgi:hypothetical protein
MALELAAPFDDDVAQSSVTIDLDVRSRPVLGVPERRQKSVGSTNLPRQLAHSALDLGEAERRHGALLAANAC